MKYSFILLFALLIATIFPSQAKNYDLGKYGLKPDSRENSALLLSSAIQKIVREHHSNSPVVLQFPEGTYHFYPTAALEREYYISNHDQNNPKQVGIPLEGLKNVILDGKGSEFIFHGRMLPISIVNCENCTLRNFSVDFENPHITQMKVVANDTAQSRITLEIAPWVDYKITDGVFSARGEGWEHTPQGCIAFDGITRHIIYNTSDQGVYLKQVEEIAPRTIIASGWKQPKLVPGTVIAGRTWHRPTPGIFAHQSDNTELKNIKIHYAEGMGLLAQLCNNITLEHFGICLKGKNDPRYFTTQADATHFSGCKGKIISTNGLYEGMMDDAINIHGTYLKVTERVDDHTLTAAYMHSQSWGFKWGDPGDSVQFIRSKTMEILGARNTIASIIPADAPTDKGVKLFRIRFTNPIDATIQPEGNFGIENLTWTPEVQFTHNIIRNNRARGALFSTPRKTVVTHNLFAHTSGTAILLCGDCNGWYETGACRDILIKNNTFINALTNMFQFTNAVISIYPEIPDLVRQKKFFHGQDGKAGIVIEGNRFETFDRPLLYAKSVQGLVFRNNTILHNQDFPAFHWNKYPFLFEKVANIMISNNTFDIPFNREKDIRLNYTDEEEIHVEQKQ